jgi:hypothetical protein
MVRLKGGLGGQALDTCDRQASTCRAPNHFKPNRDFLAERYALFRRAS